MNLFVRKWQSFKNIFHEFIEFCAWSFEREISEYFMLLFFLIYGRKRITSQQALALHACISVKFLAYASAMDGIGIYRILAIVRICVILTRRLSRSHVSVSVLCHICIIYITYIRAKYVRKKYIRILLWLVHADNRDNYTASCSFCVHICVKISRSPFLFLPLGKYLKTLSRCRHIIHLLAE